MLKQGSVLLTSADFDNAMFFALPVEVWQSGHLIDCGGRITKHLDESVYIDSDDECYLKGMCEFRVGW